MTRIDQFAAVKLQFERLNTLWSPNGETFSYPAAYAIRQADACTRNGIAWLHRCRNSLERSYMAWNEAAHDPATDNWNAIFSAACSLLDELER